LLATSGDRDLAIDRRQSRLILSPADCVATLVIAVKGYPDHGSSWAIQTLVPYR